METEKGLVERRKGKRRTGGREGVLRAASFPSQDEEATRVFPAGRPHEDAVEGETVPRLQQRGGAGGTLAEPAGRRHARQASPTWAASRQ